MAKIVGRVNSFIEYIIMMLYKLLQRIEKEGNLAHFIKVAWYKTWQFTHPYTPTHPQSDQFSLWKEM